LGNGTSFHKVSQAELCVVLRVLDGEIEFRSFIFQHAKYGSDAVAGVGRGARRQLNRPDANFPIAQI